MKERQIDIDYLKRLIKEEINEKWFAWAPGVEPPRSPKQQMKDLLDSWKEDPEKISPEDQEKIRVHNEQQIIHNTIERLRPGIADRRHVDMDATIEKVYNFIKGL